MTEKSDVPRMLGRAALRRCPNCGEREIWRGWLTMRDHCPRCRMRLDLGESDHFYGAYMLNWIAAELAVAFAFVVTLIVTWPAVPWTAVMWGTVIVAIVAPFVFYPFTRTLWLAVDLAVRPEHRRVH